MLTAQPPKKLTVPPLRTSLDGLLPCFRHTDCLNGNVDAAIFGRKCARFADGLANGGGLHDVRGAKLARRFNLAVVLDDRDRFAASQRGDVENHQPQRPAADDGDGVAGARMRVFKAVHGAGQRLGERCVLQRHVIGNDEGILGDDALRECG